MQHPVKSAKSSKKNWIKKPKTQKKHKTRAQIRGQTVQVALLKFANSTIFKKKLAKWKKILTKKKTNSF